MIEKLNYENKESKTVNHSTVQHYGYGYIEKIGIVKNVVEVTEFSTDEVITGTENWVKEDGGNIELSNSQITALHDADIPIDQVLTITPETVPYLSKSRAVIVVNDDGYVLSHSELREKLDNAGEEKIMEIVIDKL